MVVRLDSETLHGKRDALMTGGLLTADLPGSDVPDPILRSWRRCVSASIPFEQLQTRRIDRPNASDLLDRAAAPVLDGLRDELADLGVAVLLSNRAGRIVSRRVADRSQRDRLDDHYVLEGFDYSEQTVGTNGLGTSLEEKRAIWVHGAEHFNDALAVFACVGVPILSPRGGSVAGSLSLAATAAASNPMMMSLAKMAARQVEHELRQLVYARESALASAFAQRSRTHDGPSMLLTDDSVLSDTSLLPMMTPASHVALWDAVHQHRWTDTTATFTLTLGGAPTEVEARRIEDGDGPAYLLRFPLHSAGHAGAGSAPSIAERSRPAKAVHPSAAVNDRLLAAARSADMLTLNGPTGCGRLHTASELALATGRELLVLDATMLTGAPFHDWLPRAARAVAGGACVVLRHAEELTADCFDAIERIVSDRARTPESRGLLVATLDRAKVPETVACFLDNLAVGVDLPGLAEMPEAIPAISQEILETLPEGMGPRLLSSAALQALIHWSWPGNVRELRTVLHAAASAAPAAIIQTDDLPQRLVSSHRSGSLSGIERAERAAIVTALARHKGNRSRAAQDLGIGRTTLYRKIRELKIANAGDWLE